MFDTCDAKELNTAKLIEMSTLVLEPTVDITYLRDLWLSSDAKSLFITNAIFGKWKSFSKVKKMVAGRNWNRFVVKFGANYAAFTAAVKEEAVHQIEFAKSLGLTFEEHNGILVGVYKSTLPEEFSYLENLAMPVDAYYLEDLLRRIINDMQ